MDDDSISMPVPLEENEKLPEDRHTP